MGAGGTAALQKCVDLVLALVPEHRAGGVKQPAAGLERRPQRVEQLAWILPSAAMSSGRRSQRMSGWRRTMPEALHGASSRIASNGWPSTSRPAAAVARLRVAPSGAGARGCRPRGPAASGRRRAPARPGRPAPAGGPSCRRGRRRRRARGRRAAGPRPPAGCRRAGRRRPAPRPRRRRSRAARRPARGVEHDGLAVGRAAPRRPAGLEPLQVLRAGGLADVHAQAHRRALLAAARMPCHCSGQSAFRRSIHHCGWFHRAVGCFSAAATSASRSRRKRRSTALRKTPTAARAAAPR